MDEFNTVIGLEVHAELATESKIFCGCSTAFGREENTQVCPICSGMPGALPMLNRKVVEYCIRAGLALNCEINHYSRLDRKHYFYPDLPKAFQTSQFDQPLCHNGYLDIIANGQAKRIGITRIHIEEDAGKLIHEKSYTKADYNRCGVPLIEIVSEPDFENNAQVLAYLTALREILLYTEVSNCKMEEGSLRCDVNLSIHQKGEPFGTRTEMKNLNSFSATVVAVEYEEQRQRKVLRSGGIITQDTLRWDDDLGKNYVMRSKEDADEYYYFPEPDIMPLFISDKYIDNIRQSMPEPPERRRSRYVSELGLSEYDAQVLTVNKFTSDFFDKTVKLGAQPKAVANFIMGDITRLLNEKNLNSADMPITAQSLVELLALIEAGSISHSMAGKVIEVMFIEDKSPKEIVKERGMAQVSDSDAIEEMCQQVIQQNPKIVADYQAGKTKALTALVGQVMKASRGQANPTMVNEVLIKLL